MEPQIVEIVAISNLIEEEVTITNSYKELTCFAGAPPLLVPGDEWSVELTLFNVYGYKILELDNLVQEQINRIGIGYSYEIEGVVANSQLQSCGYTFLCNVLESEYGYLEGMPVSITVDRINIDFLRAITAKN